MDTQQRKLVLQWTNAANELMPHTLHLTADVAGIDQAQLKVCKPKANQTIEFTVPQGITLDMIQTAWKAQGENWKEIFQQGDGKDTPFIAQRVIVIRDGYLILWTVHHFGDVPMDQCATVKVAPPIWNRITAA